MAISSERLRRRAADGLRPKSKGKKEKVPTAKAAPAAGKKLVTASRAKIAAGSRGKVPAPRPSRMPLLVGGGVFALCAVGGAIAFVLNNNGPTTDLANKTQAPAAVATASTSATAPVALEPTPLDRAHERVAAALDLEKASREGEAVSSLDNALCEAWPFEAKKLLTDARTATLDRFKKKIAKAKELVENDEFTQARSQIGGLKRRCPDALAPALIELEKQLDQAIAKDAQKDTRSPVVKDPKEPRTPDPVDPPKKAGGDPKDDKGDPGNAKGPARKGVDELTLIEKASKVRALLFEAKIRDQQDKAKLEEAVKLVREMEGLAPDSPLTRGTRGHLLYAQRKYDEAQADLAFALAADPQDGHVRSELASCYFLYGHFDEAKELAKDQKDPELERLVYLIDGPWATLYPLGHTALETRTADGHYSVMTDAGLELGALDKLETDLGKAPAEKRPKIIAEFRKAHFGLKECQRHFEAAYKAYCKVFKIKEEKIKETKVGVEPKKEEPRKEGTIAKDGDKGIKLPINHGRVSRVYVFREKEEFAAFSQKLGIGSTEHILGYFMPSIKILAFYRQQTKETTFVTKDLHNVLFHETFHQFLDLYIEDSPAWFNEGLAEYFGISQLEGNSLRYGMVPDGTHGGSRYTNLQEVLSPVYASMYGGETPTLFALMKMNHAQFMQHGAANYAMAWGLCHYLASTKAGQKKIKAYFRALRAGDSHEEAFKKVFADVNQTQLEADFRSHVGDMAFNRPPPDDDD